MVTLDWPGHLRRRGVVDVLYRLAQNRLELHFPCVDEAFGVMLHSSRPCFCTTKSPRKPSTLMEVLNPKTLPQSGMFLR